MILRAYAVFVFMRNDIIETELSEIDNSSPLYFFKKIFEKDEGKDKKNEISTENPTGLCRRIRNSIGHGTFNINSQDGKILFKDGNIELIVEGYEVTELCMQIERLYLSFIVTSH